uniref:G protein-coupled receptor n=1 Tax=Ditylenchus dipsaci TaxID=166011 RepID=A0A915CPY1_9BILA
MNAYFFQQDFYATRYNCSAYSQEEWQSFGKKKPFLGACFIMIGVVTQVIYVPFLFGMMQKKFRDMSCYKIMFYLGILDVGNIVGGTLITGYLTWHGAVFCSHPGLIYFAGCFGVASWCAACLTCVLLAFNRCVDFARSDLSDTMFGGYKTWIWLLLPTVYFLAVSFYEMPVIYNSEFVAWFYDPFIGVPIHYDYDYSNTTHAINNIAVIFILCAENAFLCHNIFKLSGHLSSSIKRKRQVTNWMGRKIPAFHCESPFCLEYCA